MRTRDLADEVPGREMRSHLFIYDLSAPEDQIEDFAACIQGLADSCEKWASIRIVSDDECGRAQAALKDGADACKVLLKEFTGEERVDQLYIGPNGRPVTKFLRAATTGAEKVNFGDGLALNFTMDYYRPDFYPQHVGRHVGGEAGGKKKTLKSRLKRLERIVKHWVRGAAEEENARTPTAPAPLPPRPFDTHCLLLKNLFNEQLDEVLDIDPACFKELFARFAAGFESKVPVAAQRLRGLQEDRTSVSILLTSNFSETQRMTLEGEIEGYLRLLDQMQHGPDQALLIKPHPRDSHEKIKQLRSAVDGRYGQVILLDDPWSFYVPFESLFDKYFCEAGVARSNVEAATVSSACLSLEYLYAQPCVLGFGADIVTKHFSENWQPLRHIHEEDLEAIVRDLRSSEQVRSLHASRTRPLAA